MNGLSARKWIGAAALPCGFDFEVEALPMAENLRPKYQNARSDLRHFFPNEASSAGICNRNALSVHN